MPYRRTTPSSFQRKLESNLILLLLGIPAKARSERRITRQPSDRLRQPQSQRQMDSSSSLE
jgi:hypothetical protein